MTAGRVRETQGCNSIRAASRYCVHCATVRFYLGGPFCRPMPHYVPLCKGTLVSKMEAGTSRGPKKRLTAVGALVTYHTNQSVLNEQ